MDDKVAGGVSGRAVVRSLVVAAKETMKSPFQISQHYHVCWELSRENGVAFAAAVSVLVRVTGPLSLKWPVEEADARESR